MTLTVKDGESLQERFNHLVTAERRYKQKRLNALKGQKFVEYAKAQGGVCSVEFKRGQNSGLWHPHMHMIWLCSEAPDAHQLSREWEALTGDSFIVDVRPMYGEIDGFLETFKYALKFSDLNCQTICMRIRRSKEKGSLTALAHCAGLMFLTI